VRTIYVSNGEAAAPPIPFLSSVANVSDFSVVDGVAYATTVGHCEGAADGVWALDLTSKAVTKWEGQVSGSQPAFGPAYAYLASETKLVALDSKTLVAGASYDAGVPFATAPVIFEYKSKPMVAAASKDGVVHLIDPSAMPNALAKSAAGEADPYALATWQTVAETRWLVVTSAKSITAWKIVDQNGVPALQRGWAINNMASPSAPLIINGVLFALERGDRGHHASLAAFDASTGKQLWTSGSSVTSFVNKWGGLAAGGGSLYFGTQDGTLWAFGFPIEH
jgi:outer membrane protein assembly factor BamB